jgi:hypothetical protein
VQKGDWMNLANAKHHFRSIAMAMGKDFRLRIKYFAEQLDTKHSMVNSKGNKGPKEFL